MKIATWNCHRGFFRKVEYLSSFAPDLAVIQECDDPSTWSATDRRFSQGHRLWCGQECGVGAFSFSGLELRRHRRYNEALRWCLPVEVHGASPFNILGIWSNPRPAGLSPYVSMVNQALTFYQEFIRERPTLILGDFNSNAIWDGRMRLNHSSLVQTLERRGLVSLYHTRYGERPGEESRPTFFQYYERQKPFHLDYCFASEGWSEALTSVEVGSYEEWPGARRSHHVPLFFSFSAR